MTDHLLQHVLDEDIVKVPDIYWEDLCKADIKRLENGGVFLLNNRISIPFLNKKYIVDLNEKKIFFADTDSVVNDPVLILILLVYLLNATNVPLAKKWLGVNDLKSAHFFRGPHELKIHPLITCFGHRPELFRQVGETLGDEKLDIGDVSFSIEPLSGIRFGYVLWEGEKGVFSPDITILFDANIDAQLPPDTIWALVGWMTDYLCNATDTL